MGAKCVHECVKIKTKSLGAGEEDGIVIPTRLNVG